MLFEAPQLDVLGDQDANAEIDGHAEHDLSFGAGRPRQCRIILICLPQSSEWSMICSY